MSAAFAEIFIDQGSTFNSTITFGDDITNGSINLYGYTVKSQLKKSYYSQNVSDNLTCTIVDSANGNVQISLAASNTANLKPGRYVWDLVIQTGATKTRMVEGIAFVSPGVTT